MPSAGSGAPVTWFEIMGSDAARTQRFYAELFGWEIDNAAFADYGTVNPVAGRGIWGGVGGGLATRWATIYTSVPDVDETLSQVEALGGAIVTDSGIPELKSAARAALYGAVDPHMRTSAFRDPAGNVFGVSHKKSA